MIIERENKDNVIIKQAPTSNRSKCDNNTNSDDINGICTNISTINNDNKENKLHTHTPPPLNKLNDLSPGGSRTSHETRNSVVFTPANHKNSSTNSNTPPNKSPRPTPHKPSIHTFTRYLLLLFLCFLLLSYIYYVQYVFSD